MKAATINTIIRNKKSEEVKEKKILKKNLKKAIAEKKAGKTRAKENSCLLYFYFSKKHLKEMEKKCLKASRCELRIFYINGKKYTDKCLPEEKPKWEDTKLVAKNVVNPIITFELIKKSKKAKQ